MYNIKEYEIDEWVKAVRFFEQSMRAELTAKHHLDYELVKVIRSQRRHYKSMLT